MPNNFKLLAVATLALIFSVSAQSDQISTEDFSKLQFSAAAARVSQTFLCPTIKTPGAKQTDKCRKAVIELTQDNAKFVDAYRKLPAEQQASARAAYHDTFCTLLDGRFEAKDKKNNSNYDSEEARCSDTRAADGKAMRDAIAILKQVGLDPSDSDVRAVYASRAYKALRDGQLGVPYADVDPLFSAPAR